MHTRVFVIMEGGIIQNVCATDPDIVDVVVIDYDTDGAVPEELTSVPQHTQGDTLAYVSLWRDGIDGIDAGVEQMATRMFGAEQ